MSIEAGCLAVLLMLGTLPLVAAIRRGRSRRGSAAATAAFLVMPPLCAWALASGRTPVLSEADVTNRPIETPGEGYITSDSCRACHPREYHTWRRSYHSSMTQVATPAAFLGRLDRGRVDLKLQGRTYRIERRGDDFWVNLDNPQRARDPQAPPRVQRRIVMTTGSHNLQGYWYESGQGRWMEQLPFVYHLHENRWMPDHASFLRPPWPHDRKMPIAGAAQWHLGCIACHTTHGRPRVDPADPSHTDARVAEMGIACEACHGPAEAHVRRNHNPTRRYRRHFSDEPDDTIVDPSQLPHRRSSQVCGQCHALTIHFNEEDTQDWRRRGYRYRPGDELTDTRHVVRGREELNRPVAEYMKKRNPRERLQDSFWPDGTIRLAGREYNGLIESPCYLRGTMSCLSCHRIHQSADDPRPTGEWANDQLDVGMDGDRACLQCHDAFAEDIEHHTHHRAGSTGSECYNCHMPYTTYGLQKAIRSHRIDSPSVATSVQTGRPNACNQCHLDKTLGWAADHLERWYGIEPPPLAPEGRTVAASLLWMLQGNAAQRALIAWTMGWQPARDTSRPGWMAPFLGYLLMDPYDVVRFIAYRSLRRIPGFEDFQYDFVVPPDQRLAAARRVRQRWMKIPQGRRPTGDEILVDPDGRMRIRKVLELSRLRDDTPVMVRE
ncbi:MAG: C cytochrome precursor [Phycisphaerae bacterium]